MPANNMNLTPGVDVTPDLRHLSRAIRIIGLLPILSLAFMAACSTTTVKEEAEEVLQSVKDGDKPGDIAEEVGEVFDAAGNRTKDAVDDMGDKAKDALKDAGDKVEDKLEGK